jgi:DNA replication and repair protein RecF
MLRNCAVVCFEPGSHALISGASAERRRLLDWGVFHVEHDFSDVSKRYRRALRQRNAALRDGSDAELDAWDEELAQAAGPLTQARSRYLTRFAVRLTGLLAGYLPELGTADVRLRLGWPHATALPTALRESRAADRLRGHTTRGPHRADWLLTFSELPRREQLSRGQEKLCAIACVLAQAELYQQDHGEWPVMILDDLPSELDQAHQESTLQSLKSVDQVFITSTEVPAVLQHGSKEFHQFHVEQGQIRSLL